MKTDYPINVCRVCLENETAQSIYDIDENGLNIYEKIMLCADVEINPDSKWPDKICESCINNLDISYKFRVKCKNSDNLLLQFYSNNIQFHYDSDSEMCRLKGDEDSISFDTIQATKKQDSPVDEEERQRKHKKDEDKEAPSEESCTESTKTKPNGKKRKRNKASDSKYLHICEVCGNTFQYKSTLHTHMRRHTNEKPFSCEICGRQFVMNGQLTCHMRTHTGEKPYECRFCKRKYADVGARQVHERIHTGERPFKCDICNKAFMYASVLKKHKLTHTDEKQYSCNYCGNKFRLRYHLTAHLNSSKHQHLLGTSDDSIRLDNVKE